MYKKSIKITFLCLFTIFISTNVMQGQSTPLIDAIKKYEKNEQEYVSDIKNALARIEDNIYKKSYISQKDSENLDALDHTFKIYDFEVFLKVFLLLLPHIENLQKKLDEQIKLTCAEEQKDINKIAFLIYLGARCNVIDPVDENSKHFIINAGSDAPTLKLKEISRQMLIIKILYFSEQKYIYKTAEDNKQLDELTDQQKQIGELPKGKGLKKVKIDSHTSLSL